MNDIMHSFGIPFPLTNETAGVIFCPVPISRVMVFITILLLTLTPFITRDSKLKCTRFFEIGGFGSGKGGRPVKLKPISRGISTEWFKVGQIMYMPIIFTI